MTRSTPHPVVIELDVKDTALRAHARLVDEPARLDRSDPKACLLADLKLSGLRGHPARG